MVNDTGACVFGYCFAFVTNQGPTSESESIATKKVRDKTKSMAFLVGGWFSLCVLGTDLCLSLGGFLSPIEYKEPTFHGGAEMMVFDKNDGEWLKSKNVRLADDSMGSRPVEIFGKLRVLLPTVQTPTVIFSYRKADQVKELVIRDVTLKVLEFNPPRIQLPRRPIQLVAKTVSETVIAFSVRKKSGPYPWTFEPVVIQPGERDADDPKPIVREYQPISLTDNSANLLTVKVNGLDPGIYKIQIELGLERDFGKVERFKLLKTPIALLFADPEARGTEPRVGEDVVIINEGGKFETLTVGADTTWWFDSFAKFSDAPSRKNQKAPDANDTGPPRTGHSESRSTASRRHEGNGPTCIGAHGLQGRSRPSLII